MYRLFIVEDDPGIANAVAAQAQAWNLQTHICLLYTSPSPRDA